MDRWLINNSARKSNKEKVPLSSSERPGASTCSYSEPQPGTSFQSSNYVEAQKEQLDPQTSSVMEVEDEKLVDNCTEDEEKGYSTENEKKKQLISSKSTRKGMNKIFKKKFQHDWLKLPDK